MEREQIESEIKNYIKTCEDGSYSLKYIRTFLEDKYDVELTNQKQLIKEILSEVVNQSTDEPTTISIIPVTKKTQIKKSNEEPVEKKRKIEQTKSNSKFKTDEKGEPYFEV